ncbi:hypothetical protein ABC977_14995 [Thioalkalicoccus limnaeus]|uniref:Uncharacterized protein n=1 Tax=Thioalkalicoccus limnaeus TaxID=120681 RepID=A0ABV4BHL5_9GAMM
MYNTNDPVQGPAVLTPGQPAGPILVVSLDLISEIIDSQPPADRRRRLRTLCAQLEADRAYFKARLALIGVPASVNQRTQQKTFTLLDQQVGARLIKVKEALVAKR